MYPISNTNKIKGACDKEICKDIEVDFSKIFNNNEVQLKQFPEGGTYCNHDSNLYFTGGQEFLKSLRKIFIKISYDKKIKK